MVKTAAAWDRKTEARALPFGCPRTFSGLDRLRFLLFTVGIGVELDFV